jgi:hypothetical protein
MRLGEGFRGLIPNIPVSFRLWYRRSGVESGAPLLTAHCSSTLASQRSNAQRVFLISQLRSTTMLSSIYIVPSYHRSGSKMIGDTWRIRVMARPTLAGQKARTL